MLSSPGMPFFQPADFIGHTKRTGFNASVIPIDAYDGDIRRKG
jgi:hypothetical protein